MLPRRPPSSPARPLADPPPQHRRPHRPPTPQIRRGWSEHSPYPEDTKAKRAESFRVPEQLLPYLTHYLKVIRTRLLGRSNHDGLWASYRGRPLIEGRIYDIIRARLWVKFRKLMGLHDVRRHLPRDLYPRPSRPHSRGAATRLAGSGRTALQSGQIGRSNPSIRCTPVETPRQAAAALDKERGLSHACRHLRQVQHGPAKHIEY